MMETFDNSSTGVATGLSPEAVAFMLEMGLCPGADCPMAAQGCDPRCPALVDWVEGVSDG